MPYPISEIKQFVPWKGRNEVNEDPEQNSVLGNIQLLIKELEKNKSKTPVGQGAIKALQNVLDACNEEKPEKTGNSAVNSLSQLFTDVSNALIYWNTRLKDEQDRNRLENLIGYTAAGLGLQPTGIYSFKVTEEQKQAAAAIREAGREAVKNEDPQAKWEAKAKYGPVNAYRELTEQKLGVSKLPKRGVSDPDRQEQLKRDLDEYCVKIFSLRRAAGAERNQKNQLMVKSVERPALGKWETDMRECETFRNFLAQTPYEKLRALAAEGHGGAMEEAFQKYVSNLDRLPEDVPQFYLPKAKQRIETLKAKIESKDFLTRPANEREALYVELLATRAAVNSERNKGSTLERNFTGAKLEEKRQEFREQPLKGVLAQVMARKGGAYAREAALTGHGGLLEDRIRDEFRELGKSAQFGYRLPGKLPNRLQPSYTQRMKDIQDLVTSGKLDNTEKMKRFKEFALLASVRPAIQNEGIDFPREKNADVEKLVRYYDRVESAPLTKNLQRACLKGGAVFLEAMEALNAKYYGDLHAAKAMTELAREAENTDDKEKLMELAAKKMLVSELIFENKVESNEQYRKTGAVPSSGQGVLKENVDRILQNQTKLESLKSRPAFQSMCAGMTNEELKQQIRGGTYDLTISYNAERDRLQRPGEEIRLSAVDQKKVEEKEELLLRT